MVGGDKDGREKIEGRRERPQTILPSLGSYGEAGLDVRGWKRKPEEGFRVRTPGLKSGNMESNLRH